MRCSLAAVLFVVMPLASSESVFAVSPTERAALRAVFEATQGLDWAVNTNWVDDLGGNSPPGSECSWFGVTCSEDESTVVGIGLRGNNLSGPLPSQLGDLENLESLDLAANSVTGQIPETIERLTQLRVLSLGNNMLSGYISPALGNLPRIEYLDLSFNMIDGPIPAGLFDATSLSYINLSSNFVSGEIPESILQLEALRHFDASGNRLSGSLPEGIEGLNGLSFLDLSMNRLSGGIPKAYGQMRGMRIFSLADNQLTGAIPPELGGMDALTVLNLQNNRFTGMIPGTLGLLGATPDLREIRLDENELDGGIPAALGALHQLQILDLRGNNLSGPIPKEIGALQNLQVLALNSNSLQGEIPSEITNLTRISALDLRWNALRASNAGVLAFVDAAHFGQDWMATQTRRPGLMAAEATSSSSIRVSWNDHGIPGSPGYVRVTAVDALGDEVFSGRTFTKDDRQLLVWGLQPSSPYTVLAEAVTPPSAENGTLVTSDSTDPVSVTTMALTGLEAVWEVSLADGQAGHPYRASLIVQGGVPPFQWEIESGLLPPQLALESASGRIAGVPLKPGDFDFAVTVRDSAGNQASGPASIRVLPSQSSAFLGAARTPGRSGTVWRTDAVVIGHDYHASQIGIAFAPRDSSESYTNAGIDLGPEEVLQLADIVGWLGIDKATGSVSVSGADHLWLRTYNVGGGGTYGQSLPGITREECFLAGDSVVLPVIGRSVGDSRTNLVLMSCESDSTVNIDVSTLDGLEIRNLAVAPGENTQVSSIDGDLASNTASAIEIVGDGKWYGYSSIVDGGSGDPTTFLGFARVSSVEATTHRFIGIASARGSNDTTWRSSALFVPSTGSESSLSLSLIPRGASSAAAERTIGLAPGSPLFIDDVYGFLGLQNGVGTLIVEGSVYPWIRTFNQTESGTFGQRIPDISGFSYRPQEAVRFPVFSPMSGSRYRTNLLALNLSDGEQTLTLTSSTGVKQDFVLPVGVYVQIDNISSQLATVEEISSATAIGQDHWVGWLSVVDNATGDPTTMYAATVTQ
jgi:Leucine-rich repeat (LRR) protein